MYSENWRINIMARKIGSKDTKKRAAKRTAYETYEYWYSKYTKGTKEGWFRPKYTKAEFEEQYTLAKRAGLKNPARMVAASQEYVDRSFEKKYKKLYGKELGDIRNIADREAIFSNYVNTLILSGMTFGEARDEFEKYFY